MIIAAKVLEGFESQGWQILGSGGSWTEALRPLESYIRDRVERAVKAEREACAKVCDELGEHKGHACAYAIRARSKE